ncbi:MAG TPA: hypothetical protein PLZ52_09870 [Bacteroidales bacterium]|mgnify:FL=1|nr:hypothetical protein [Bacteroidales bacterium]HOE05514.1 hypothetical protein [Bacteroidales bacterium]HQL69778.1 hypothetical protein [Bacteroidales bacterium]
MKITHFLLVAAALLLAITGMAQEYKVITSVESIIPMGVGRSRIIEHQEKIDPGMFTTMRVQGNDSKQGDISRDEIKIDKFEETKLLNFFSAVGINFRNIASNDAMISAKINQMVADGWELAFVVTGVESYGGKDDDSGIFITRYIFKRAIK